MTREEAIKRIEELKSYIQNLEFQEPEMVLVNQCENPFYIGKYPVTQALWKAVMKDNPSFFNGDTRPVENVSWNDAQAFIAKLNELTGKSYRLPTEYEWMIAATVDNTIYSGSDDIDEVAWYDTNSDGQTHPVGLKKPNSLGIYDMSGNVWEWCQDWYEKKETFRVVRGGSWYADARFCRIAFRDYWHPESRNYLLGFRLVLPYNK